MQGITLRRELESDRRASEEVTREAFFNHHTPGCDEHYLLHIMRGDPAFVPELDFVAESDGRVVGHIAYTRARIVGSEGVRAVLCFGPVSVLPEFQGRGIGGMLIRHTLEKAREMGFSAVLIYGDPAYYARFGFLPAERFGIGTPDGMYAVPLQAIELVPGALAGAGGRFYEADVFEMDAEAARAFDRGFPKRELRDGLLSQARFRELVAMRVPMPG